MMNQKQADKALARNLRKRRHEKGFNPVAYKKKWYEVGRRIRKQQGATSVAPIALLAASSVLMGCAHPDPWTKRDTWGQIAVTTTIAADAWSSRHIHDRPGYYERGAVAHALMGNNPTPEEFAAYSIVLSIASYGVARALPEKYRPAWQIIEILVHGSAVINNCELGLC